MTYAFTPDELVSSKGKTYPVIGGRLRVAHENGLQNIATTIIQFEDGVTATVEARVRIATQPYQDQSDLIVECEYNAHGTASMTRDGARMKDTLLELAESRAVARALRYAGFGCEFTGAEEVSHLNGGKGGFENESAGDKPVRPSPAMRVKAAAAEEQDNLVAAIKNAAGVLGVPAEPILESNKSAMSRRAVLKNMQEAIQAQGAEE